MGNIVYAGVIPIVLGLVGLIKQFFGDALFPNSPDRRAATLQFLAIALAVVGSAIVYWATADHTERQGLLYALGWGLVAGMAAVGAYHVSGQGTSGSSAILTSAVGTLDAQPPVDSVAVSTQQAHIRTLQDQLAYTQKSLDEQRKQLDDQKVVYTLPRTDTTALKVSGQVPIGGPNMDVPVSSSTITISPTATVTPVPTTPEPAPAPEPLPLTQP